MVDLSARPADSATRQVVLARAGELAARFNEGGEALDTLQIEVHEQMQAGVAQVNQLLRTVANLNERIAAVQGLGQPPNDLLDLRDQALSDLSQQLQISTVAAEDGSLTVMAAGGQALVLGSQVRPLALIADASDSSRAALGVVDGNGMIALGSDELGGGALAGLLRFQNDDLVDARTLLGRLAVVVSGTMNAQQALGLDMGNPPAAGSALFSTGPSLVVPATSNAVNGAGQYTGQVSLTLTDLTQLQASEYELRADPAGAPGVWQLTRLQDGLVRSIASGDIVDGLRIDVGPTLPSTGDRYLLQPVTRGANGMQRVLDDIQGLAAASPLSASVAATNTGTGSVAALRVVSPTANAQLNATVSFTNASGAYAWELRDRSTNNLVSSGTGTWSAGTPIALNGFELSLNGAPRSGDVFSVTATAFPDSNNGNAVAFTELRDAVRVGRVGSYGGETFTNAYAAAMADIGVRVQAAGSTSAISTAVAAQAEAARAAKSGVNLDEEAARLIQYQQAYQAAAKILQVAQTLFQSLLDGAG